MLVLGLTTSTPQIGVALADDDGLRAATATVRGRHHAELLAPAIVEVCEAAEVTVDQVDVVAVDTGPGLFTGLRVGVATAKAVAFGMDLPVVPVSSLDLLAFGYRYVARRITATIDARRGELFVASYVPVPGGIQRVSEPHTATAEELAAELQAEEGTHLLVGNGAPRYADTFAANDRVELADASFPSPAALVALAHARARRDDGERPEGVRCTYLREPDAQINWQTRDGRVGAPGTVEP